MMITPSAVNRSQHGRSAIWRMTMDLRGDRYNEPGFIDTCVRASKLASTFSGEYAGIQLHAATYTEWYDRSDLCWLTFWSNDGEITETVAATY